MTAFDLSTGPFFGALSGAASSNTFTSVAGQFNRVKVLLSQGTLSDSVSLLRSTDGGSTWTPVASAYEAPDRQISAFAVSGTTATATVANASDLTVGLAVTIAGASVAGFNGTFTIKSVVGNTFTYTVPAGLTAPLGSATMNVGLVLTGYQWNGRRNYKQFGFKDTTSALYQIVTSDASGSAFFVAFGQDKDVSMTLPDNMVAASNYPLDFVGLGSIVLGSGGTVPANFVAMSAAKFLSLYQTRWTSLGLSDVAGAITLYKRTKGGALATLSVPAGAQRAIGGDLYSPARCVRASSVTVTALVDVQNNPVTSDVSTADPQTTYAVGTTITARDLLNSGKALADGQWGIHGYMTKLEAATLGVYWDGMPGPNLAALGL